MLKKLAIGELKKKADYIRANVVDISVKNGAGHIAPSLSSIDLLAALYYSIMDLSSNPQWEGRDRLVFSKAHGCYGVYAILADLGYIDKNDWISFYKGSFLSGCLERSEEHGLEAGCGSLGHGLPQAVGLAFGARLQKKKFKTYCIVGDGEMQEGSNWEAMQFAVKHKLSNLVVIIDNNKLQAMDFLRNILTPDNRKDDLKLKLKAFGCEVQKCDGHKPIEIINIIGNWAKASNMIKKPRVLIADTIKGYGLMCMENVPKFHFRIPTKEELMMGARYKGARYKKH